jgi:hypothetical protein
MMTKCLNNKCQDEGGIRVTVQFRDDAISELIMLTGIFAVDCLQH